MLRTWTLALLACGCRPAPGVDAASPPPAPSAVAPTQPPPPKRQAEATAPRSEAPKRGFEFRSIDVPDFDPAVVAVPAGDEQVPLVVAAHGAGDTPEAQCEIWAGLTKQRALVLCPRGVALRKGADAYFYRNHFELEREFVAALDALRKSYGPRIKPAPAIYTGYSQGATMGALMIGKHAGEFRRLVLIEGGFDVWNLARAREFKRAGGERVMLVCGTGHCRKQALASVEWLTKAGVEARLEHVEGGGHAYWGAVADRVFEKLDWVL